MSDKVFVHKYPGGRLPDLDELTIQRILDAVPKVFNPRQVARECEIHPVTLRGWLNRGESDHFDGKDSIYSQFYFLYHKRRANSASELICEMRKQESKFKTNSWLLERGFKNEYGQYKDEFRHFYAKIASYMKQAGIDVPVYDEIMEELEFLGG